MFKRSILLVTLIGLSVFSGAFITQWWSTQDLPSSYDPGISIEQAFKTSKVPLLVEFYSDTCGTCRHVTPQLHDLQETRYKGRLTLVMLDVSDSSNQQISSLFGVSELPGLFVFDAKRMKKAPVNSRYFQSKETLRQGIDEAMRRVSTAEHGSA